MWASPISPSISAFGVSAATESTTTSVDLARAREHLDDLEGLLTAVGLTDTSRRSVSTPMARA
jgi:hypothetical protein